MVGSGTHESGPTTLRPRVVVIGGGHAGVEAAWAAANLLPEPGSVALVTLDPFTIGVMSCNPAIGGLAKGQLVREVDALHGLMGLATDATGIQFRVLNTSKGPAVQGPRAQCDKHAYAEAVQRLIALRPQITVVAGSVESLRIVDGPRGRTCRGVVVAGRGRGVMPAWRVPMAAPGLANPDWTTRAIWPDGSLLLEADAVVLTTGTFMRGLMHTGESKTPGGRYGEGSAVGISAALRDLGLELGRLKTGTPPRLQRDSIDWGSLLPQHGDTPPTPFSDLTEATTGPSASTLDASALAAAPSLTRFPVLPQVPCHQTSTTREAHDLIRANLHRAPMYSGQIESVGPRYCPSIEDKVVRFAERESHGVFLEPESLRDDWIYCNGISTSLPADVQDAIVRAMPGCGRARILRYGYAVEYDMVRPHQILASGEVKSVAGLFLAGQINGTSGYEEAAAQGIIAGINAGLRARGQEPLILGRDEAYIGVLMDDLVTKTPVEPYRMFTSRAEHRLLLRADNAADRLTPRAHALGLLGDDSLGRARWAWFQRRQAALAQIHAAIEAGAVDGTPLDRAIRSQGFELHDLRRALGSSAADDGVADGSSTLQADAWEGALQTAYAERRYGPYIERQHAEVRRQAQNERKPLPTDMDYERLPHLRTEARHALARFRPATFGQASRLEGITPADLTLLAVLLRQGRGQGEGRGPASTVGA